VGAPPLPPGPRRAGGGGVWGFAAPPALGQVRLPF